MSKNCVLSLFFVLLMFFSISSPVFAGNMPPEQEIRHLRKEISKHNYKYYILNTPEILDSEYDRLFNRLLELEREYPDFQAKNSPTESIGSSKKLKHKVKYQNKMYSLKKVYSINKLENWYNKISENQPQKISCEPKLDGLAVSLIYKNGKLIQGYTRGDGQFGEDVVENLRMIHSIPKTLNEPLNVEIRGEVVVSKANFAASGDAFATPRNYAAGSLRQKNPKITVERNLNFVAYQILGSPAKTQLDSLIILENLGFEAVETVIAENFAQMESFIVSWPKKSNKFPYPTDGVVFKVNEFKSQKACGYSKNYPNWAMAYKYCSPTAKTTLKNIEFSMGKNGILTPVAVFEPVEINGTKCERATLHNISLMKEMNLCVNDKITIEKTGEILPHIVSCEKTPVSKAFFLPKKCPYCGETLSIENKNLKCENKSCSAKLARKLAHFASKDAMDIAGLGEANAQLLVERLKVVNCSDIYKFSISDFENLDGFDKKSADNLYCSIQNSLNSSFEQFLYALNIPYVGKSAAAILAKHYKTLDALQNADISEISAISGINKRQSKSIVDYFKNAQNKQELAKFKSLGFDY